MGNDTMKCYYTSTPSAVPLFLSRCLQIPTAIVRRVMETITSACILDSEISLLRVHWSKIDWKEIVDEDIPLVITLFWFDSVLRKRIKGQSNKYHVELYWQLQQNYDTIRIELMSKYPKSFTEYEQPFLHPDAE